MDTFPPPQDDPSATAMNGEEELQAASPPAVPPSPSDAEGESFYVEEEHPDLAAAFATPFQISDALQVQPSSATPPTFIAPTTSIRRKPLRSLAVIAFLVSAVVIVGLLLLNALGQTTPPLQTQTARPVLPGQRPHPISTPALTPAATFVMTPAARRRFQQNDIRESSNTLFDTVVKNQQIRLVVSPQPQLVHFAQVGQHQFAWVDVAFAYWQSQIDPANPQQRWSGLDLDPATKQPRIHQVMVLLLHVPAAQAGPPCNGRHRLARLQLRAGFASWHYPGCRATRVNAGIQESIPAVRCVFPSEYRRISIGVC